MKNNYLTRIVVALYLSFFFASSCVYAADPLGIRVGNTRLFPSLGVTYFRSDNVFATNTEQLDSSGIILSPEIQWKADLGLNTVAAYYEGEFTQYDDADNADSDDHIVGVDVHLEISSRSRFDFDASVSSLSDDFTTNLSQTDPNRTEGAIEQERSDLGVKYKFGSDTAKGNILLGIERNDIDYNNKNEITNSLGYVALQPSLRFLYRVSVDTQLVVGISNTDLDYDDPTNDDPPLDRKEQAAFVGATWNVTGKSGGTIEVGQLDSKFDSRENEDGSTSYFSVEAFWKPVEFSTITITASRDFARDAEVNTVRTKLSANWFHRWSSRFNSAFTVVRNDDDTEIAEDKRTTNTIGLRLSYDVYGWLDVTMSIENTSASASLSINEYDEQWLGVGFVASL